MLAKHHYPGMLLAGLLTLAFGAILLAGSAVAHAMPAERLARAPGSARAEQRALRTPLGVQAAPLPADAFASLSPCNIAVTQGTTFTLDLFINGGSNIIIGQQSYLTFTNSLLQVVDPKAGCGNPATTVQLDPSSFEVELQNTVDNASGLIGFASGTFGPGAIGTFRVARITFCAQAGGVAQLNWQFSPPAPPTRNSKIIDAGAQDVTSRAAYQNCSVTIAGPATTPTQTPTPVLPTRTRTPLPPTQTPTVVPLTSTETPITTLCPSVSPTPIGTPIFTPRPGCSASPPSGVLEAVIIDHPTTTEARFTNHSTTCSYPIGLAVYKRFDDHIDNQELYDYRLAVIPPNSTLTLTVNNPSCSYQGDAFDGNLIESFAGGVRYGERRLDDTDGVNRALCIRCNPGPP